VIATEIAYRYVVYACMDHIYIMYYIMYTINNHITIQEMKVAKNLMMKSGLTWRAIWMMILIAMDGLEWFRPPRKQWDPVPSLLPSLLPRLLLPLPQRSLLLLPLLRGRPLLLARVTTTRGETREEGESSKLLLI
jgi:hypothetical protein